jgi:hypothetical protein
LPMNTLGRSVSAATVHKAVPFDDVSPTPSRSVRSTQDARNARNNMYLHPSGMPSRTSCAPTMLVAPPRRSSSLIHPPVMLQPRREVRRLLLQERLKPWIPALLYALTSLGFVVAITMWKAEVFQGKFFD